MAKPAAWKIVEPPQNAKASTMRRLFALVLTASPMLAMAASLPLQQGNYVEAGTGCKDAPNAVSLTYDGQNLYGAHSQACHTTVLSQAGSTYTLSLDCQPEQVGPMPAQAYHEVDTVTVTSDRSFTFAHHPAGGGVTRTSNFRRCEA